MSFECCTKIGSYSTSKPKGTETKLGDRPTYVTGDERAARAIIIIADVYGWSLVNTRVLADRYAHEIGARVYIPDFFDGDDLTAQAQRSSDPASFKPDVPALLANFHPREAAWPRVDATVNEIRKAQPSAKKIGSIGFCWGAPSSLWLGSQKKVDAVAFAHPSLVETSDFEKLNVPGLFQCCEHDAMFPDEKREPAIEASKKRAKEGNFSKFSYYPFVSHGWTIKGDEKDPYVARAMAHAAAESIAFFKVELAP